MMKQQPIAFMSYVRSDDEHESGRLTKFRERLSGEVRMQTGEEFVIFQDRTDIKWGENWKKRVDESLDGVIFLIPIITPGFFKSIACRDELQKFLDREKKLKRDDLILPVYYVDCPILNDETERASDELAQVIASRNYADWRELRFEPFTSPQVRKELAELSIQIRDAIGRVRTPYKTLRKAKDTVFEEPIPIPKDTEFSRKIIKDKQGPSSKTEPPTHVVDPMHRGDHATITEAIKAANPGDRIIVRPGLYHEGLIIDKPLEIIGEGDLCEIIIQPTGNNTLLFKTTMGRVVNLSLRQRGGEGNYCVNIAQGRLELEGCDITSQSSAGVYIHNGADPRLRRNNIHDSMIGVFVSDNSQGTLEDNDIFNNEDVGVGIKTRSNTMLRRNSIHDSMIGVFVSDNSQGTLEDNDIFNNEDVGVGIKTRSNTMLRRNSIHDSEVGVFVYDNSQGTLEDNDIFNNENEGVRIRAGSNTMLRRNSIHDSNVGVIVYDNSQGTLEDNDIFNNENFGVAIITGGSSKLLRNRINKNGKYGVFVHNGGEGTIEENDLQDNVQGALDVSSDSKPKVKIARNKE